MSTYDRRRTPLEAAPFVAALIDDFEQVGAARPLVMGSIRRYGTAQPHKVDGVGDLDVIVVPPEPEPTLMDDNPSPVMLTDVRLPPYLRVTPKKAFGWREVYNHGRMMVDGWWCPAESVGAFAMFLTGPPGLNIVMRQISVDADLMLTQYGLFRPVKAPTKTYPNRVKPGVRVDDPSAGLPAGATMPEVAERAFWRQWTEAVGLGEVAWPRPEERGEVTRWLQERARGTRSGATSPG